MRRDWCEYMLTRPHPQFFVRVSKDKYAMVDDIKPGEQPYVWDESLQKIVPYDMDKL